MPATAQAMFGNNNPTRHTLKANFVWVLPTITSGATALRAIGLVAKGGANINLTGSPALILDRRLRNLRARKATRRDYQPSPRYRSHR
jgi:hypothetical protein